MRVRKVTGEFALPFHYPTSRAFYVAAHEFTISRHGALEDIQNLFGFTLNLRTEEIFCWMIDKLADNHTDF